MQAARVLRPLFFKNKQVFSLQRNYAKKKTKQKPFPQVTMNDLPNPEGDFYTEYNKRQKMHNLELVVGIGAMVFGYAFGVATNMFEAYDDIPDEMPEIECYK